MMASVASSSVEALGESRTTKLTSKNAKRRQRKKEQRSAPSELESETSKDIPLAPSTFDFSAAAVEDDAGVASSEFADVFQRFQAGPSSLAADGATGDRDVDGKGEVIYSDDDQLSESEEEKEEEKRISKRRQRKLRRLTVAELKQLVKKPELVEGEDVTATDPQLLIQLKSTRNTIPIPPHWNLKREYLQNKKGIEKPPFQLPSYIAATGIAEMKDALKEKEAEQTLKAKTRERVQPKMGKVVIDYQKLHDAFFRFQTKPESLTRFGEVYYEGKEFETKFKERRPGDLSKELKEALSIPPLAPPPWLIAMQRFGPPPSYPQLRIPGLNAPIPDGAQWGYHPGGWGHAPTDEYGNSLFGDVTGQSDEAKKLSAMEIYADQIEREPFGELESDVEAEESDEEGEESEADEEEDEDGDGRQNGAEARYDRRGLETPIDGLQTPSGLETPGGYQSVASTIPGGLETPRFMELRKDGRGDSTSARKQASAADENGGPKHLYHVLPEREMGAGGKGFFSGDHGYDIGQLSGTHDAQAPPPPVLGGSDEVRGLKRKAASQGAVEINLDASELEGMSDAQLAERYEQARQSSGSTASANGAESADLALLREELQRKRSAKEAKRSSGR